LAIITTFCMRAPMLFSPPILNGVGSPGKRKAAGLEGVACVRGLEPRALLGDKSIRISHFWIRIPVDNFLRIWTQVLVEMMVTHYYFSYSRNCQLRSLS
jgi:hypothetical protein